MDAANELSLVERSIVALDCSADEALKIARQLQGRACWLKVGMTLFYEAGGSIVLALKDLGFKVFLDLKMHDIPHQVAHACSALMNLEPDMLTFHCLGGPCMLLQAQSSLAEAATRRDCNLPISLGVTILTSMDAAQLESIGLETPLDLQVEKLALIARNSGLSGVVCSPLEASSLRSLLGEDASIVVPGVRLPGQDTGDQRRVLTPRMAFNQGASHIVIGRPITQSEDIPKAWDLLCAHLLEREESR